MVMCLLLPGEPAAEGGHGRGGAGQEQVIRGHCQQVSQPSFLAND